jgi:transposase
VTEFKLIAMDTSKHVFTLHGLYADGRPALRRELTRAKVEAFFQKLPSTEVVLEACGGSHHWGRRLTAMGHRVRLLPPQYVKPFVKRSKNDRIDAEAIAEAALRPNINPVPVKSAETQAQAMALSVRELLVKQHTQLVNAFRGHATEFGLVAPKGPCNVAKLLERIAGDPDVPDCAKTTFVSLGETMTALSARISDHDRDLLRQHKNNELSQRLAEVPGIGPITALTLALTIDPSQFQSGRHFSAWIGLTPKEHSTGGKQRMGGISRQGNERLRQLLVLGATSVVKVAKPGRRNSSAWLLQLLARKPRKVAAVALANKMARIVWAMMTSGEAYRSQPVAA